MKPAVNRGKSWLTKFNSFHIFGNHPNGLENLKSISPSSKLVLGESKVTRIVIESYSRSSEQKNVSIEDSDFSLLGLDQQKDCLVITGKRKVAAKALLMRYNNNSGRNGIGIDSSMRSAADISIGDTVIVEKVTPLLGEKVMLKPIEEIILGISSRVVEYIPFGLKDNPLIVGERISYTFDGAPFVFSVVAIHPQSTGAIIVTKDTRFGIA